MYFVFANYSTKCQRNSRHLGVIWDFNDGVNGELNRQMFQEEN